MQQDSPRTHKENLNKNCTVVQFLTYHDLPLRGAYVTGYLLPCLGTGSSYLPK